MANHKIAEGRLKGRQPCPEGTFRHPSTGQCIDITPSLSHADIIQGGGCWPKKFKLGRIDPLLKKTLTAAVRRHLQGLSRAQLVRELNALQRAGQKKGQRK